MPNYLTQDIEGKQNLFHFAKEVIQVAFDGGSLDGGEIQEMAVKHGLLVEESYDPEKHGEDRLGEFEEGDQYYVYADVLKSS